MGKTEAVEIGSYEQALDRFQAECQELAKTLKRPKASKPRRGKRIMSRVIVRTGTAESFFRRARSAARRADEGEVFDGAITLSFEDPQRMFAVLSAARRELVRAVIGTPMTVADLTRALKRERTAIAKDVKVLEAAGLVRTSREPNPGHGVKVMVQAAARRIDMVVTLAE
jgi:predicted transcriptional regulator